VENSFRVQRQPQLVFGHNTIRELATYLHTLGTSHLCVVASKSVASLEVVNTLLSSLRKEGFEYELMIHTQEPNVSSVDTIAQNIATYEETTVIGIGGGSVLDTAKAASVVAYQLQKGNTCSVKDFLEGVGDTPPPSQRLPLILIPTTAGTGSESTNNAVISEVGPQGFKKSLRHDSYVADIALVDPSLLASLDLSMLGPTALDALTQNLEAYTSQRASPYISSLVYTALVNHALSLKEILETGITTPSSLSHLAYGAYISGIAITSCGLGYVHALAGPMGALHPINHSHVCSMLISPINNALREKGDSRYLELMNTLEKGWGEDPFLFLEHLTQKVVLPPLKEYGFTLAELDHLSDSTPQRDSLSELSPHTLRSILYDLY